MNLLLCSALTHKVTASGCPTSDSLQKEEQRVEGGEVWGGRGHLVVVCVCVCLSVTHVYLCAHVCWAAPAE